MFACCDVFLSVVIAAGAKATSLDKKIGAAFAGQEVLVVGFGNSGGEIACALAENGVNTTLSVRGPVNVLPRDIFGIPVLSWAIAQSRMSPALADRLSAPLIRWAVGDIRRYGLEKSRKGPTAQVVEDGRVPLIDAGTLDCLRRGEIVLKNGIESAEGARVHFADGTAAQVDAIVCATGYRPDLRSLLPDAADLLDRSGQPHASGAEGGRGGLYFCNYHLARTGQLREAGLQAVQIRKLSAGSDQVITTKPVHSMISQQSK